MVYCPTNRESGSMSEALYWLGFSLVPEIGPRRIALLKSHFNELRVAWDASEAALRAAGLEGKALTNFLRARPLFDLARELDRVYRAGAHIVTLDDDLYPANLKPLQDAPPVLYVKGELTPADTNAIAVVGTRKATHYGQSAAQQLCKQLASHGVTIISGLAQGIDAAAHQGALDGGRTIAVLGSGIDRIYPPEHYEMATRIIAHGALVSEFPLGAPPEARNFPRRNRVISGMARGVMVIEAPEKSGALITATLAADQGRDVFAVPGSIFSRASTGTHRLIQDGAALVTRASDVLNALHIADIMPESVVMSPHPKAAQPSASSLELSEALESDIEIVLMRLLGSNPMHIDDLARAADLPIAEVSSTLTILELKGLAQNVGHMQYCLSR
jgi:DNA processing protein